MSVMILSEHRFEFPSLKGDCTGSSEFTLVKMPHSLFGKHMSLLKLQILMVSNRNPFKGPSAFKIACRIILFPYTKSF